MFFFPLESLICFCINRPRLDNTLGCNFQVHCYCYFSKIKFNHNTTIGDEDCGLSYEATAPVGRIQEFQPDSELWSAYVERIKLYFTANDIANGKEGTHFPRRNWSQELQIIAQPHCSDATQGQDI